MKPAVNPMLDAIDALTIEHVVTSDLDDGTTHFERHDGLIKQLREAIASNLGGTAGGKPPRERIPLDADALVKYEKMETAIGERYRHLVGPVPGLYPEQNLRDWYQALDNEHRAGKVSDSGMDAELSTMLAWVRSIEEKLSPPTKRELVGEPCPECGFAWYDTVVNVQKIETREPGEEPWVDSERTVALTVTYRPDMHGGLMASFAKCGCCNHVWMGAAGIRALAYELEHAIDTPMVGGATEAGIA